MGDKTIPDRDETVRDACPNGHSRLERVCYDGSCACPCLYCKNERDRWCTVRELPAPVPEATGTEVAGLGVPPPAPPTTEGEA